LLCSAKLSQPQNSSKEAGSYSFGGRISQVDTKTLHLSLAVQQSCTNMVCFFT
jgi:hypothetical protein